MERAHENRRTTVLSRMAVRNLCHYAFSTTWLVYWCCWCFYTIVDQSDAWLCHDTTTLLSRTGTTRPPRHARRKRDPIALDRDEPTFGLFGRQNSLPLCLSASTTPVASTSDGDTATNTAPQRKQPHLVFPGGGIFFYHQAGVVTYLREQGYDLTTPSAVTLTGASAGALTATLTATGVDFYQATELALQKARHAGVWDRPEGLQGIWGGMIYEWLDELLPADALERITGSDVHAQHGQPRSGLCLLVTPLEKIVGRKERISEFASRQDLIECNMASIHIPWFLDGRLTRDFRNRPHIDGSFLARDDDYHSSSVETERDQLLFPKCSADTLVLNHNFDPAYESVGLLDFVATVSEDRIWRLLEDGKKYAKYLEETGRLEPFPKKDR